MYTETNALQGWTNKQELCCCRLTITDHYTVIMKHSRWSMLTWKEHLHLYSWTCRLVYNIIRILWFQLVFILDRSYKHCQQFLAVFSFQRGKLKDSRYAEKITELMVNGGKLYRCLICQRCLKDRSHMQDHVQAHYNKEPYHCPACGKPFTIRKSYFLHMRQFCKAFKSNVDKESSQE